MEQGFAVWITGLPASGKSSLAGELALLLRKNGITVVVLESDAARKVLTPEPNYTENERDRFYWMFSEIGKLITKSGAAVIFDATANKRSYRDNARSGIPRFLEVFVNCPLEVCKERDPKGIYARASSGAPGTVPGLQVPYEPPLRPEVTIDCRMPSSQGAETILHALRALGLFCV